jgi:hypothetical protein
MKNKCKKLLALATICVQGMSGLTKASGLEFRRVEANLVETKNVAEFGEALAPSFNKKLSGPQIVGLVAGGVGLAGLAGLILGVWLQVKRAKKEPVDDQFTTIIIDDMTGENDRYCGSLRTGTHRKPGFDTTGWTKIGNYYTKPGCRIYFATTLEALDPHYSKIKIADLEFLVQLKKSSLSDAEFKVVDAFMGNELCMEKERKIEIKSTVRTASWLQDCTLYSGTVGELCQTFKLKNFKPK